MKKELSVIIGFALSIIALILTGDMVLAFFIFLITAALWVILERK